MLGATPFEALEIVSKQLVNSGLGVNWIVEAYESLFEGVPQSELGPPMRGEAHHHYLQRSGRLAAAKLRALLDEWWQRFPEGSRGDLLRRLRNDDDAVFLPGFFELYLHELAIRHGYSCEVHFVLDPSVDDRNVDFRLSRPGEPSFLLEAIVPGTAGDQASVRKRKDAVYAALGEWPELPYYIYIREVQGEPRTPVPARRLRADIANHFATVDPAALVAAYQGAGEPPRWTFERWIREGKMLADVIRK